MASGPEMLKADTAGTFLVQTNSSSRGQGEPGGEASGEEMSLKTRITGSWAWASAHGKAFGQREAAPALYGLSGQGSASAGLPSCSPHRPDCSPVIHRPEEKMAQQAFLLCGGR